MIAQELEVSLHMAFVEARQQRHEFITVEHLLMALLDNPSAAEVLRACAANIDDLPGGQIVSPPLLNAVTTLPADEQYSFLLTERFGAIQGYTAVPGDNGRDVPTPQALDHALLNTRAQDMLVAMQFARGNLDAPDEIIRLDTTGPLGSSDHDGFVLFLRNEGIFSNGFE